MLYKFYIISSNSSVDRPVLADDTCICDMQLNVWGLYTERLVGYLVLLGAVDHTKTPVF